MERFLVNNVPTVWLAVGMVVVAVATAIGGLWLARRSVEVSTLEAERGVAGFIIAAVGVISAVLLAFGGVIEWEESSAASSDAPTEATAVGNLSRDAVALGPQGRSL